MRCNGSASWPNCASNKGEARRSLCSPDSSSADSDSSPDASDPDPPLSSTSPSTSAMLSEFYLGGLSPFFHSSRPPTPNRLFATVFSEASVFFSRAG